LTSLPEIDINSILQLMLGWVHMGSGSVWVLQNSFNGLMRTVAGIRRSQHVRITDLYSMTTFDPLTKRRQTSPLYNFMSDVRTGNQYSVLRNSFVKLRHNYATRAFDNYVVPMSRRDVGHKRVCVRGLRLLNDVSNDVAM
jgi:hypothetical protein